MKKPLRQMVVLEFTVLGKGVSNASGKSFSVDGYHYFVIKEGKIVQSGDFFDATGMVMSVQPDSEEEVE